MLYARVVRCPHAHAKHHEARHLRRREAMPGVKAVQVVQGGRHRDPVGARRDRRPSPPTPKQVARDAVRAVKVEYEVLPHFVTEERPGRRAGYGKAGAGARSPAIPTAPSAAPTVKIEGTYGMPLIAHSCLEAHGQVTTGRADQLTAWCSTQAVSAVAAQLAEGLKIPASDVRVTHRVHGRRLRQQVLGRPLGDRRRRAVAQDRRRPSS